ncbi:MAG: ABC transporter permease subunit [Chloroflexi bacterium]|nr:ABC transporter permease subunit [Chloroflexota bacterium]
MTRGPLESTAWGSLVPEVGRPSRARNGLRSLRNLLLFAIAVVVVWEGLKAIGGDPWHEQVLATGIALEFRPPFKLPYVSDLELPHIWDIAGALLAPVQRESPITLGAFLLGAAAYTWYEAIIGFLIGGLLGILLATIFVHSRLAERAFVPYVVASQTIPIVALAPMIVFAFGQDIISVVIIATYLTFFPVTIAGIRGLASPDPRALELMRSYAANRRTILWKVRLPASVPYLFTAFKISATASIVGAIIGEGPGGVPNGLGRAIINFNQQYISGPEKLWAAIFVSAAVGVAFYLLVRLAELWVLRARPHAAQG